jgi:NAD(P)-dependent dehydrogenase (short-subunit alcohol dehydrogenase family)
MIRTTHPRVELDVAQRSALGDTHTMKRLQDKAILITGASAGLGAAVAKLAAREGARVALAARRRDKGEAVLAQITAAGGEGIFLEADVTKRADVESMVAKTVARFGRLDCAVNNAGVTGAVRTPLAEISEEDWDTALDTNLKAVWMCMKYEIPAMLAHGRGAIVDLSSIYGLKPSDVGHAPYSASKHGVIGLTRSAAVDYGAQGIRVNAVCPGFSHSEMVDPVAENAPEFMASVLNRHSTMNRLGESDEIAEAIVWLCSDASSFVNGASLAVDGGETTRLY